MNYTITWQYIVEKMEEKYNISPKSIQPFAYGELTRCLDKIWSEYFQNIHEVEEKLHPLKHEQQTHFDI